MVMIFGMMMVMPAGRLTDNTTFLKIKHSMNQQLVIDSLVDVKMSIFFLLDIKRRAQKRLIFRE